MKRVINSGLDGTSVTCVLVGSETYARRWVIYEIMKSFRKGNSLLAVHINSIKERDKCTKPNGLNPLKSLGITNSESGLTGTLLEFRDEAWKEYSEIDGSSSFQTGGVNQEYRVKGFNLAQWCPEYDWVAHNEYENFGAWIG